MFSRRRPARLQKTLAPPARHATLRGLSVLVLDVLPLLLRGEEEAGTDGINVGESLQWGGSAQAAARTPRTTPPAATAAAARRVAARGLTPLLLKSHSPFMNASKPRPAKVAVIMMVVM